MIVWLIAFGIVLAGVAVVVATQLYEGRVDKQIAKTADWLETEATIQNAAIERLDKYTWYPGFAFSYSVGDEYFSGKFFLEADQEQSEELVRTLRGHKFPVQYDPSDPSAWYIAEATISGYEIIQKLSTEYPPDAGPCRSDGGEPIDLHLDS
jgi:uncharacterized protein DUF3592